MSLGTGSFEEGVDGISITKKIREWEQAESVKKAHRIPVIGLSANQKHCQRCLEVEMNTFQLKPIQETRLMQSILQVRVYLSLTRLKMFFLQTVLPRNTAK